MTHGDDPEARLDDAFAPPPRDINAMRDDPPNPPAQPIPATPTGPSRVRCLNCGYDLTGATIGGTCPECGMTIGGGTLANAQGKPTSGNAIASLVLGICSLVLGCGSWGVVSLVCGPLAIWFARRARADLEAGGVAESSAGLANAGRVMGWISVVLTLVLLTLFLGFFCLPAIAPALLPLLSP